MNKKSIWWLIGAIAVLLVIVGSILLYDNQKKEEVIKVGIILPGSSQEPGWNGIHYQGVKSACDEFGVEVMLWENASEYSGECEKAIEEMVKEGVSIIFLESYNYSAEALETLKKYPDIAFYCCSKEVDLDNYTSYFARVYQARYLSGILAGMMTKSNEIGYVAAMNNSEVNRGVNAFALGVKSVNKDARIHVVYTESWDNEEIEKKEVEALVKEFGVDILSYHQNQPFVVEKAQELGVYSIGYNIEKGDFSELLLTSVVCNWDMVYREVIGEYLQNKHNRKRSYWVGIEKSAVGLAFYSDSVPESVKEKVSEASERLSSAQEVFSGEIYDNKGNIRCSTNEVIHDEILLNQMDWLVEGVDVYEND